MKPLNETKVEMYNHGVTYTKVLETEGDPQKFLDKFFKANRHSMDLSKDFKFKILYNRQIGFTS